MALFVGLLGAMLSLLAGFATSVDPVSSLWRAILAFFIGYAGVTVWQAFYVALAKPRLNEGTSNEEPAVGE